ncbi:Auxin-responsive GH3 family protein [Euphorbia peplus]|nr:Auxin-responsive GH3 family protein [Euphorbia peplus]
MEPTTITRNGSSSHDIISWFDHVSEMAGVVQRETLRRILELNCNVEYLKKWLGEIKIQELDESTLEKTYTSLVPLVSHKDIEPFIQRIADGDTSPLLTQQPITTLSLSSGTTEGRQKYVPFTGHSSQTTLQIFSLAAAYRSRVYPIKEGGKVLEFIYSSKQFKTKGGLTVGTATTHYYASEEFKIKQEHNKSFTTSPQEVISCGDYNQSTYCHLLLGLLFQDEIEFITSTFAYSIVQAFRSFEELWQDIVNDIKTGTLNTSRITSPRIRQVVLGILKSPNPVMASRIEKSCKNLEVLDWGGLIPELWPNVKYVYSIMTGSMQPYLKKLRHYSGTKLPLVSADYGSTESWIGVNVEPFLVPEEVTFAVIPTFSYFEFMPLHRHKKNVEEDFCSAIDDFVEDEPVTLSKVKVGQLYEIILTTFTGLYRCRLGDVVEVSGFHNSTPKLNFICRRKLLLTVNIDKNTEKDLQISVEKGLEILISKSKSELVDFTSHAQVDKQPGHYVIYWEIRGESEDEILSECSKKMDESFVDYGYVVSRKATTIGPLELCVVQRGTFKKILDYFIENGGALSQFKTPRCTNNPFLLRILDDCTIKRFYSNAYQ